MEYTEHFNTKKTHQMQPIPGKDMVKNTAGGYTFEISFWGCLDRFLVLGNEGGTYYASEKKLTQKNAKKVIECIKEDGVRAVEVIKEMSVSGRAPKNDPAIFALALCCTFGDKDCKGAAYNVIENVCRIGTHLFQFCEAIKALRGWSAGLRAGVSNFYLNKKIDSVAYQLIKYQQRNGWSHKDVLRLAHPNPRDVSDSEKRNALFRYVVGKDMKPGMELPDQIWAFKAIQEMTKVNPKFVADSKLPRECIPTSWLNNKDVWAALLETMPITAMIRNLGKMTNVGLLKSNFDDAVKKVVSQLGDMEVLKKGRVHPLALLTASKIYQQGCGMKGSLKWKPVGNIADAMEEAYYMAFDCVEPTGKNCLIGLDVSSSMGWGQIAGSPLNPAEAAAAMCMITVRTEPYCEIMAFASHFKNINITKKDRFDAVLKKTSDINFGRTDCALPVLYALKHNLPVDAFFIYTDNETYAGTIHPSQALLQYRKTRSAKLCVIGMTATEFSIADPKDPGMMDFVGFDMSAPRIMADFIRG